MKSRVELQSLPDELLDPSISNFLDNQSLASFGRTNKGLYGLFKPKLDQRLEEVPGIHEEFFFRSFEDKSTLTIKKTIETWCRTNKIDFKSLAFKGNVKMESLGIDENVPLYLNNSSNQEIKLSQNAKGKLHIAFHHSFLPPSITKVLPDFDMAQNIKSLGSFNEANFESDVRRKVSLSQAGSQELIYKTTFYGSAELTPEELEHHHLVEIKKGTLFNYKLLLQGSVGKKDKFIPLSDLFPESVEKGFVVFNLRAPVSFQDFSFHRKFTSEELRAVEVPGDPRICLIM